MQINVSFDQAASSLPTGFVTAVNYVVNYFNTIFVNPVTININVGYGEIGGQQLSSGALGESESFIDPVSYSQTLAALNANKPDADQQAAYATLPATSPLAGGTLWMTTAEEKALGLLPANAPAIDGYVGFSNQYSFSYSPTVTPGPNQFNFIGVVEHEISEVLGRDSWLGAGISRTTSYGVMDLFRYSAPNVRDLTATPPSPYNTAYFSINNGTTNLDNWNTNPGGDLGDWANSAGPDAFLAFSPSGQMEGVTPTDITAMNILGWDSPTSNTVISNQNLIISAGQTSTGLNMASAGTVIVLSGGTAISTTDSGGGTDILSGGTASSTTVSSGGTEVISSGGHSYSATVLSGGLQYVFIGGTASGTTVSGGGEVVSAGGVASGTSISSNGYAIVLGSAVSASVQSGAIAVSSGGVANATTVGTGGVLWVVSGAMTSGTRVSSGGAEAIMSGETVSGTTLVGGGEVVFAGGTASSTMMSSGWAIVSGNAVSLTMLTGAMAVASGGVVNATTVGSGGAVWVTPGGVALGTRVSTGGSEVVSSGASVSGITLQGTEAILSGAVASGALLSSGGLELIYGSAVNETVLSGANLVISSGGVGSGTTISNGGVEYVAPGGIDSGTTLGSGGTEVVYAGGIANGVTVDAGGAEYIVSGGTGSGTTLSGGGAEVVSSGGVVSGTVTFVSGGALLVNDGMHFGGTLVGFNSTTDMLDLVNVPYLGSGTVLNYTSTGVQSGTNIGTLTVTNSGTLVASVALLGTYIAGSADFVASSDGYGGTIITDPPVTVAAEHTGFLMAPKHA